MKTKAILSLLLFSAVCVTPASANWFHNPRLNLNLNVGSAPNPRPADLRGLYAVQERTTVQAEVVPPPPPPPPPRPPFVQASPPPAPIVRQYVVFFDFDRSNLTPEAQLVVGEAVRTARQIGPVRIVVTGHTDTVGSFRYNQALSERRAASVRAEMVRQGLNNGSIVTVGRSFSEPLIATGPGVREPQNRRAVIDLGPAPMAELR